MGNILCWRRPDNSIAIGYPSAGVLAAMTGTGGLIRSSAIDDEYARFVNSTNWNHLSGAVRESAIRSYLTALASGGVTEVEALALLDQKDRPSDCTSCRVIDEIDLPTSDHAARLLGGRAHNRDAWEDDGVRITVNMSKARAQ